MKYRRLGTTGVSVSALCLDSWIFGIPSDGNRIYVLAARDERTGKGYKDSNYPVRWRVIE